MIPTLSVAAITISALEITGAFLLGGIGLGLETGVVPGTCTPCTMPRFGFRIGTCLFGGRATCAEA